MALTFNDLPYGYDALEPHIDARTMEIHYDRHHRTYFTKMQDALAGTGLKDSDDIAAVLAQAGKLGPAVRNNAGGYYNHNLFWACMAKDGGGDPEGDLGAAVAEAFGSADKLREEMNAAGVARFGSGFAWLILKDGALKVVSTPNQDNPLMDAVPDEAKGIPLLCIDVWEHAYYLKYQNKRPDYLAAFWNVVDWKAVAARYDAAKA
ncbi:MAG: superoxide dismutase [Betaproteobacteria bacterium AqS2]|uniref:Superoxide dismutase n=1 Tax=Candidatus Amphirhobacter heronislandensis TaxID=1732024 RepID=A0A930UC15_9GAMM|nr:superoxide dismutase [Betaproteobacteria bacterium AqS2]